MLNKNFNLSTFIDNQKYYLSTVPSPANYKSINNCMNNIVVLIKDTDKKKQNKKKQVMYNKEPQPVKVVKESINEDIIKMKKLISFK
jgi:hypothetical protein